MIAFDCERLAADFLRALRGKRSQRALSRRLGYRTNIAYTWESGRSFPTAARTFAVAERVGIDVRSAIGAFFGTPPAWVGESAPATREGVARLLAELRGRQSIVDIARAVGKSRFATARWLQGLAEPRLP